MNIFTGTRVDIQCVHSSAIGTSLETGMGSVLECVYTWYHSSLYELKFPTMMLPTHRARTARARARNTLFHSVGRPPQVMAQAIRPGGKYSIKGRQIFYFKNM